MLLTILPQARLDGNPTVTSQYGCCKIQTSEVCTASTVIASTRLLAIPAISTPEKTSEVWFQETMQ
jgi:hypothetical protein